MKKIIALALSLMLLLGCVSALAESAEKGSVTMLGAFTIEYDQIPDGYKLARPTKNSEMEYEAMIQSPEVGKPNMILLMAFNDEWEGVETLADATEEDIAAVKQDFYDVLEFDDGDLIFEDGKTGEGTPIMIVKSVDGDFGAVYTIYKGHEIEIDIFPEGEEDKVTDELFAGLNNFLTNVKFTPIEK
jgi:hypothetical protein